MRKWHYWNANNGFQVAVAGVVTMTPPAEGEGPDEPFDWAAYIGATQGDGTREMETVAEVDKYGSKLSKELACAIFPQFAKIPYRY